MIRALEVARHTGVPISHRQTQFNVKRHASNCNVFSLQWNRQLLHDRINCRVNHMFDAGLVDEIRGLLERYGKLSRTASQAVGYREVIEWIRDGGEAEPPIENVSAHTRQLARRQETWLRSFCEIRFIAMSESFSESDLASQIQEMLVP